jgi:DNA-binding transcriptional LysR family regulator
MEFKGLDLNLLIALKALLEEKNITRTGERIHLSQPATSGALAKLRSYFSDELLVRIGHKMVLTPLAEQLLPSLEGIFSQLEGMARKAAEFVPATSKRRFTLMLDDYAMTVLVTEMVKHLQRVAPLVGLDLRPLSNVATALEQGNVDFLILPEGVQSPAHPWEEVFTDEHVCAVWSENRKVGKTVSFDQYFDMSHISFSSGGAAAVFDDFILAETGRVRQIEVVVPHFNFLAQLLVGTNRIASIPRRLANYYAPFLPIRILDAPLKLPRLVQGLQWHKSRETDLACRWFRQTIQEVAVATNSLNSAAAVGKRV